MSAPSPYIESCTTVLAGNRATSDGSVLMATSCDGNVMGRVYVREAQEYPGPVPRYFDCPAPSTWEEQRRHAERGDTRVGDLEVRSTYRCLLAAGHFGDSVTGGMNEHGLSLGIEYMGMRPELANPHGTFSTCSSHWTSSLIANCLLRAGNARDAIRLMGALVEEHGFTYYCVGRQPVIGARASTA